MEGYLDLNEITEALGNIKNLPSPQELQDLMGEAEKIMFIRQGGMPEKLLDTAWLLHSIGVGRESLNLYDFSRRKRASQISSHIFDLFLDQGIENRQERLIYTFAAQIGYIRGDQTPNATALYGKIKTDNTISVLNDHELMPLELAVMLLALDRNKLFRLIPELQAELAQLSVSGKDSPYFILSNIIDSIWELLLYLIHGHNSNLISSKAILESIVRDPESRGSLNARWVAAHLNDIVDLFGETSLWSIIPPEIPSSAVKALSLGSPPILTLWPPQVELLKSEVSPLLLSMKRVILSVPTSAGKTLISQLFISSHLSQNGGGVCVVAPSHSLCREISKSLSERLSFMNLEVVSALPDEYETDVLDFAPVEVMTPERLNFLIRSDPVELLNRFKLFIIDEAHLVNDSSRGWNLEVSLSLLNDLTQNTEHRIVMMSAALGHSGHIKNWLDSQGESVSFHSEWRGPRRLFAMYSPEKYKKFGSTNIIPTRKGSKELTHHKLQGVVRLRIADTDKIHTVSLVEPVGDLYYDSKTYKKHSKSTPLYKTLAPFLLNVAETGPVLVVESSKKDTLLMAKELAERTPDEYFPAESIANFAELRLGIEHPLPKVLRKGIAYHHSALPNDVQDAIEAAVKNGQLKFIISTTTLAEGVNLPVRTVVISHTGGFRNNGEFEEFISGSTLINAIGRAGRAGKESEGWIILAGIFDVERLNKLIQVNDEDITITSSLVKEDFLESLLKYEELVAAQEDAIMTAPYSQMSDFISQVWSITNAYEEMHNKLDMSDLSSFLNSTLGWTQMTPEDQGRWLKVTEQVFNSYEKTDGVKRKRWAKTGASLPTSQKLETLAYELFNQILMDYAENNTQMRLDQLISEFFTPDRIKILTGLPESRKPVFKKYRSARNDQNIDVDIKSLLIDWVEGKELDYLVSEYLHEITDIEYAYESLGTFLTSMFEQYLPWVIGILVKWINEYPQEFTEGRQLVNTDFPLNIRFGVDSAVAIKLMIGGIRSRGFAKKLSLEFVNASDDGYELMSWLRVQSVDQLRDYYHASDSEVDDYKSYVSSENSRFLADLIEKERSELQIYGEYHFEQGEIYISKSLTSLDNDTLSFNQSGHDSQEIPIEHHREIERLMDTGLPFTIQVMAVDDYSMSISVFLSDYRNTQ